MALTDYDIVLFVARGVSHQAIRNMHESLKSSDVKALILSDIDSAIVPSGAWSVVNLKERTNTNINFHEPADSDPIAEAVKRGMLKEHWLLGARRSRYAYGV